MNQQAHPDESQRAHPAIRDDKLTEHTKEVQYTSKCSRVMMLSQTRLIHAKRVQIWLPKPCRTSANTVTETDPNEIPNDCNWATAAVLNKIPNDCNRATEAVLKKIPNDCNMASEAIANEIPN
jgi:hypothetical protein